MVAIYWTSTWMVTDIHDVLSTDGDQPHPIFSVFSTDLGTILQSDADDTSPSECQVCSYDHGGHFGQMLTATPQILNFNPIYGESGSYYPSNWFSLTLPPKYRPPIT